MSKKITINELAVKIDNLSTTIDDLAAITARGFENTATNINRLEIKVTNLEEGQENIILRLDSMAPNFEIKELKKRVAKIEKHVRMP